MEAPESEQALFDLVRRNFPNGSSQAYAYLVFVLIYVPCVAAMAAAIKEMGWVLGSFMALYTTLLAWIVATLFYQFAVMRSPVWIIVPLALLALLVAGIKAAGPVVEARIDS